MQRTHVDSSDLKAVGYDRELKILEIEFHNGGVYQYVNVPENVFGELMRANSVGAYFNAEVRDRFQSSKIN